MNIVEKYGGTSVGTIEQIQAIALHAKHMKEQGHNLVIVASAMGKTTNKLIELAHSVTSNPNKRELDSLLSTGEQQTITLLAIAMNSIGLDTISLTGYQAGFLTSKHHSRALIKDIDTTTIQAHLDQGKVVVVAGFQGATEYGDITTLVRGGSDTTAVAIAAKLGYLYVDTGAIYRTIGYHALTAGIDPKDEAAVAAALPGLRVELTYGEDGLQHMFLNGQDVTKEIRLPEVSMYASAVSAHPAVRAYLLEMQRELARTNNVIMDGRDIGTVVLPDAQVKVFLTASPEARARRRMLELEQRGIPQPFEQILTDIQERDWNDSHRAAAPLRQAEDAVLLDTTELTFQESEAALLHIIRERTEA